MSEAARLGLAFIVAGGATLLLTPPALRLAARTSFYDHPVGYKGHGSPTPYLGGVAVVGGLLISSVLLARGASELLPIMGGVLAMHLVGTIDDRFALGPAVRMLVQAGAGAALFAADIGWSVFSADALNLAFTIVFVLGVVNAYNLMDNMDGATSTVAAVSGAGLGVFIAAEGDPALGAIGLALAGACAGFLRFNLASPARIFLGDGGSTPVGFAIAALILAIPAANLPGGALVPVTVVLVGLPALDTTLVIVSRLRRGVGVFTGGRDHITHRLGAKLGSPRRVALVLGCAQAGLCGVGAALLDMDSSGALLASGALILVGMAVVARLESPRWAPAPAPATTSEFST